MAYCEICKKYMHINELQEHKCRKRKEHMREQQLNNTVLQIGKFQLWKVPGTEFIFIGLADGEGGGFNEQKLEKHLQEFYDAEF